MNNMPLKFSCLFYSFLKQFLNFIGISYGFEGWSYKLTLSWGASICLLNLFKPKILVFDGVDLATGFYNA